MCICVCGGGGGYLPSVYDILFQNLHRVQIAPIFFARPQMRAYVQRASRASVISKMKMIICWSMNMNINLNNSKTHHK